MNEDVIDITKLNNIHTGTYLTKDEFINMLQNLRFIGIERANINFITGFEYDAEKNITKTRGYDIVIS